MRKNQNRLSESEKRQFVDAVLKLKAAKDPNDPKGLSKYDRYVQDHVDNVDHSHFGPAFLSWHRQFLIDFERDLQDVSKNSLLGLPYWDWSPLIFGSDEQDYFMGGDGTTSDGKVTNGPFAAGKWKLNVWDPHDEEPHTDYLKRQLGKAAGFTSLPPGNDVTATLNELPFDTPPWNDESLSGFRNTLEGIRWDTQKRPPVRLPSQMHGRVHRWIGGSMVPMSSPNDPVFWLHHCFIDKLWADWQAMHGDPGSFPLTGAAPGHNGEDAMRGPTRWGLLRNIDVNHHRPFLDRDPVLGYRYDTENKLFHDEELHPFQWIWSPNGRYTLWHDGERGRLVLSQSSSPFGPSQREIWNSGTRYRFEETPRASAKCIMEGLGNLVIYDNAGGKIWESGTHGNPGAVLEVMDDGHVRIYNQHIVDSPLWRRPPPAVG
jgi:tyrosinase